MRTWHRLLAALLIASVVLAENPPPRIQDEGGTLAPYFNLNCVGAGVTCSTSGINATITIPTPTPAATPSLQQVTTVGQITNVGVTLDDDTALKFGSTSGAQCKFDKAVSADLLCENTLADPTIAFALSGLNITSAVDLLSSTPNTGATFTTSRSSSTTGANGIVNLLLANNTGAAYSASSTFSGLANTVNFSNPNDAASITAQGIVGSVINSSTGDLANIYGFSGSVGVSAASTNGTLVGVRSGMGITNGTNTDFIHFGIGNNSIAGGTLTNWYGLKLADLTGGVIPTNVYGIYVPSFAVGTNRYPLWMDTDAKIHLRESSTSINSSATGNLDLNANTAVNINTADLYVPADNKKIFVGDSGSRGSIYHDGTDMIINPAVAGTGVVRVGATADQDLMVDQMSLCNTAIDSLAVMRGTCTSSAGRGVLDFKFTKSGSNGVAGNILSALTNTTTATAPVMTGVQSSVTDSASGGDTGNSTWNGFKTILAQNVNITAGKHRWRALDTAWGSTATDGTGAEMYMIGVQARAATAITNATNYTWSFIGEDDWLMKTNSKFYVEGTGGDNPANGDSYYVFNSATTDWDFYVDATKVLTLDNDWADFTTPVTVANNLGVSTNKKIGFEDTSGTLGDTFITYPSDDLEITVDNVKSFDIDSDWVDNALPFTNAANFGVTSGSKVGFEDTSGTLGDTFFTYASSVLNLTVDNTSIVDFDNALPIKATQPTNDTTVQQLVTTATNDDPTEKVRQGRVATTDATVTTINTIATTTDTSLMVDCDIVSRRTGGSAGTAGDVAAYKLYCSAKNVTGTVTEIAETEAFTGESQAAWDVDCAVSGTNYLVRVTGAVNNNVTWHSTCRTYEVGS